MKARDWTMLGAGAALGAGAVWLLRGPSSAPAGALPSKVPVKPLSPYAPPRVPIVGPFLTVRPLTVDQLLTTCPTSAEIAEIHRDFNISFDPAVFRGVPVNQALASFPCTPGGSGSNVLLGLYNLFRVAKLVTFDAPMPLLNTRNVYEWAKAQRFNFRVIASPPGLSGSFADPDTWTVWLSDNSLSWSFRRVGYDPSTGLGAYAFPAVVVHEGWHLVSGLDHNRTRECTADCRPTVEADGSPGNTCGANDSSLSYGGAWAASYWYNRWLAEHSGPYLSDVEKRASANNAAMVLRERICDPR